MKKEQKTCTMPDIDLINRKNLYARNINVNLIVEYQDTYDPGMERMSSWDGYNRGDYYDYLYGTLDDLPVINASNFNKDILTLEGKETTLNNVTEQFEGGDSTYSGVISFASTNIFKYLKYDYDEEKDIYYIKGVQNISKIAYLGIGFGKERIVICSRAFSRRNINKVRIGPNVIVIEDEAFPSLTYSNVEICEGVDYIGANAFTIARRGAVSYGGASIPSNWHKDWNKGSKLQCDVELLKLASDEIEDKVKNYDKYSNVTWVERGETNQEELFESVKNDKHKFIQMLKLDNRFVEKIPEEFKNDKDVISEIIFINPSNFKYAGEETKKNKDFVLKFIRFNKFNFWSLIKYVDESLLNDIDFMSECISLNDNCARYIGSSLIKNREFWLKMASVDGEAVESAGEDIKNDKEIALVAIQNKGLSIKYFSDDIRKDRDLALEAIKDNGSALGYIDPSLRFNDDMEIVKMAIASNCYSLRYASDRLRKNEELALYAVKVNSSAIDVLDKKFLADKQFIRKAIKQLDKNEQKIAASMFLDYLEDPLAYDQAFIRELEQY